MRTAARAEVENCESVLASVKREIAEAAEKAALQAQRFREFLDGVKLADNVDSGLAPQEDGQDGNEPETPENYSSPSELMKSIYAIQGRELPTNIAEPDAEQNDTAEDEAAQDNEDHVLTVDDIINAEAPDNEKPNDSRSALGSEDEIDLDALINDVLNPDKHD